MYSTHNITVCDNAGGWFKVLISQLGILFNLPSTTEPKHLNVLKLLALHWKSPFFMARVQNQVASK